MMDKHLAQAVLGDASDMNEDGTYRNDDAFALRNAAVVQAYALMRIADALDRIANRG
jgi:hypothetical protein